MTKPQPILGLNKLKEGDFFLVTVPEEGDLKGLTWDSSIKYERGSSILKPFKVMRAYKPGSYVFTYTGDREITDVETRDIFNLDEMTPLKFFQLARLFRISEWYEHTEDLQKNVAHIREAALLGLNIDYEPAKKRSSTSGVKITQDLPDSEYFKFSNFDIIDQTPSQLEVRLEGLTLNKMMRLAGANLGDLSLTSDFGDSITKAGTKLLENGVYVTVPTEIANERYGKNVNGHMDREFGGLLIKPPVIARYGVEHQALRMETIREAKLWADRIVVALSGK